MSTIPCWIENQSGQPLFLKELRSAVMSNSGFYGDSSRDAESASSDAAESNLRCKLFQLEIKNMLRV
jgi:hypothetical protein